MYYRHTVFHIHLRKFYDQNCVLRCQTDKSNQTDLHVNVVILTTQELGQEATKYCARYGQQYCQRNGPAFVQCSQAQEYENQGDDEDFYRAIACFDFVAALVYPFKSVAQRQSLFCTFFQSCHRLTSGVTRTRVTGNFNSASAIETSHNQGSMFFFRAYQSVQRNQITVSATYIEVTHIIYVSTIFFISLHDNFPSTTEVVDVVNFVTAQESLQSTEYACNRNVERFCFFTVYFKLQGRSTGIQSGVNHTNFRTLTSGCQESICTFTHGNNIFTTKVHQVHTQSTGVGSTRQRSRLERHYVSVRNLRT